MTIKDTIRIQNSPSQSDRLNSVSHTITIVFRCDDPDALLELAWESPCGSHAWDGAYDSLIYGQSQLEKTFTGAPAGSYGILAGINTGLVQCGVTTTEYLDFYLDGALVRSDGPGHSTCAGGGFGVYQTVYEAPYWSACHLLPHCNLLAGCEKNSFGLGPVFSCTSESWSPAEDNVSVQIVEGIAHGTLMLDTIDLGTQATLMADDMPHLRYRSTDSPAPGERYLVKLSTQVAATTTTDSFWVGEVNKSTWAWDTVRYGDFWAGLGLDVLGCYVDAAADSFTYEIIQGAEYTSLVDSYRFIEGDTLTGVQSSWLSDPAFGKVPCENEQIKVKVTPSGSCLPPDTVSFIVAPPYVQITATPSVATAGDTVRLTAMLRDPLSGRPDSIPPDAVIEYYMGRHYQPLPGSETTGWLCTPDGSECGDDIYPWGPDGTDNHAMFVVTQVPGADSEWVYITAYAWGIDNSPQDPCGMVKVLVVKPFCGIQTFSRDTISAGDTTDIVVRMKTDTDDTLLYPSDQHFNVSFENPNDEVFGKLLNPCTQVLEQSLQCVTQGFKFVAATDTVPNDGHAIKFFVEPVSGCAFCPSCGIVGSAYHSLEISGLAIGPQSILKSSKMKSASKIAPRRVADAACPANEGVVVQNCTSPIVECASADLRAQTWDFNGVSTYAEGMPYDGIDKDDKPCRGNSNDNCSHLGPFQYELGVTGIGDQLSCKLTPSFDLRACLDRGANKWFLKLENLVLPIFSVYCPDNRFKDLGDGQNETLLSREIASCDDLKDVIADLDFWSGGPYTQAKGFPPKFPPHDHIFEPGIRKHEAEHVNQFTLNWDPRLNDAFEKIFIEHSPNAIPGNCPEAVIENEKKETTTLVRKAYEDGGKISRTFETDQLTGRQRETWDSEGFRWEREAERVAATSYDTVKKRILSWAHRAHKDDWFAKDAEGKVACELQP